MLCEICDVLLGSFFWSILKLRDGLNYSKIVLVLTGDNEEVDEYALMYIDNAIQRKRAEEAIIYVFSKEIKEQVKKQIHSDYPVRVKVLPKNVVNHIYRRYLIDKFYKNIFWTYTDNAKNNLLGRFMRETDINAEDVVCLAIYNFRCIPERKNQGNVCC